ncbi:MAG: synthase epsilon subunit [Frankiales bacterium]|nr:synthase epsilon subunit [Frankiales bacterium]
MAELHVELVSVEREVWSGEAREVIARTTEGEVGILPGHAPLLGQLADGGTVRILQEGGEVVAAVSGGFLSVTDGGVTVLAEVAEMAADIDANRARAAADRARAEGDDDALRRAEGRLRAVGQ